MEILKLYTVSWSIHCSKAEKLLNKAQIHFEKIDLDNWELVDAASRDIGIQKLPALRVNGKYYEGLGGISEFIEENQ